MKKVLFSLVATIVLSTIGSAQVLDLKYVIKTIENGSNFGTKEYLAIGTIDKTLKEDADIFLNDFKVVFETFKYNIDKGIIDQSRCDLYLSNYKSKLNYSSLQSFNLVSKNNFTLNIQNLITSSFNEDEFINNLNLLGKRNDIYEQRLVYILTNVVKIIKSNYFVNTLEQNETDLTLKAAPRCRGWWQCWGKCAAGTIGGGIGGGIVGGLTGCGSIGGVGFLVGGPVGAGVGCAVGGISGAIGGALTGAAASCD